MISRTVRSIQDVLDGALPARDAGEIAAGNDHRGDTSEWRAQPHTTLFKSPVF